MTFASFNKFPIRICQLLCVVIANRVRPKIGLQAIGKHFFSFLEGKWSKISFCNEEKERQCVC